MKLTKILFIAAALMAFCVNGAQAQVMKTSDLEKYAKQRYGDKWLDAAANLAAHLTLDKNQSLTYQQVIQAPGKTKSQLYVALNYWATATFREKNVITLNDKEDGCIIVSPTIKNIAEHMGTLNKYSVSITPVIRIDIKDGRVRVTYTVQNYDVLADVSGGWLSPVDKDKKTVGDSKRKADDKTNANLYDEQWEIAHHYPFVPKDSKKRTCAKALIMTHAYSNAIMDKVEERWRRWRRLVSCQAVNIHNIKCPSLIWRRAFVLLLLPHPLNGYRGATAVVTLPLFSVRAGERRTVGTVSRCRAR